MEIRQIQYFLAIAEKGSFSSAADDLNISQSSLSKQVKALEKELGVRLFDRSKRQITLTEAGKMFRKHALRLCEGYKTMQAALSGYKKVQASFAVVALPVITQYGITSYIGQFKEAYPEIHFTLDEREGLEIIPALNDHQFDLGFLRDNFINKNMYSCLEICQDVLLVVVSRRHRFASRPSISLAELANENFIMLDKGTILYELSAEVCKNAGFEPRVFYSSLHLESIFGLVASNIGIALMMGKLYDYYKNPEIVAIPLDTVVRSNIILAYLKNKKLSKDTRAFVNFMEKMVA
jgi:LysR family transcriptional regulator, transcription activator of glutamate synthase operon